MNTRSKSDKNKIEESYKAVLEGDQKTKIQESDTPYTSTPIPPSQRVPKKFNLANTLLTLTAPECTLGDSDDSGDKTIKPLDNSKRENPTSTLHKSIIESEIMTQSN